MRAPNGTLLTNRLQPSAGSSSTLPPQPLAAEGKDWAKPSTPHRVTIPPAEELRTRTTLTEGLRLGYPAEILAMAAEGGHTWGTIQSAYEVALHLFGAYNSRGEACDLTRNPLIQRMVESMIAKNRQMQARADTLPLVEDKLPLEMAAEMGSY